MILDKVRVNSSGKIEVTLSKSSSCGKIDVTASNDKLCDQAGLDVEYRDWTLTERTRATHDVDLIVLRPPEGLIFQVPTGHHVQMRAKVEGMDIARSYTPVVDSLLTDDVDSDGSLHFLIKTYDDGALTPKIKKFKVGDSIPVSNHTGSFSLSADMLSDRTHFALLAAGTGFTPMVKLIKRLIRNKTTKIRLVFFNKTEEDIIWREELEELQFKCGGSFKVDHVLSNQGSWSGLKGRISEEILGPLLISDAARCDRKFAAVCGPNRFTDKAKDVLNKIGYYDEEVILFQG